MFKNILRVKLGLLLPCALILFVLLAGQSCKKEDSGSSLVTPVTTPISTSGTSTTVTSGTTIISSLRKPISDVLGFSILDITTFPEHYLRGDPLPTSSPYYTYIKDEADWLIVALNKDTRKFVQLPFTATPNVQVWWIPEARNGYYVIMSCENGKDVYIDYNLVNDTQFRYADGTLTKTQVTGHGALTNVGGTTNNTNRIVFGKL